MAAFRVLLIILALTAPVWALSAVSVYACSCAGDLVRTTSESDLVIVGTAASQRVAEEIDPTAGGTYMVETTLGVDVYLKGSGPESLSVLSRGAYADESSGSFTIVREIDIGCQWAPTVDVRYIMFLNRDNDAVEASGCGSYVFNERAEDLVEQVMRVLQDPDGEFVFEPLPAAESNDDGGLDLSIWPVVIGVLVLGAAGSGAVAQWLRGRA